MNRALNKGFQSPKIKSLMLDYKYMCNTLHGWIKGKSRDTTEMYPLKEGYK